MRPLRALFLGFAALASIGALEGSTAPFLRPAAARELAVRPPHADGSTLPAGGLLLASQIPGQDELLRIGADVARGRATGNGVRVAVVDTGILWDLEGVHGSIDGDGWDTIDDDDQPTDETNDLDDDDDELVDEMHGHGSFVASLVLAVAPDARIVPFRALDADGVGTSSSVAQAIGGAVAAEVDVILLSVYVDPADTMVRNAISMAQAYGIQVIASAGNTGDDALSAASQVSGAVVVTAVDADDVLADFASYGAAVDLSAPGVDLSGAYPASPGTAIWSGTSFSAALVAGGFALLKELEPTWTNHQIVTRLAGTSVDVDGANSGHEGEIGSGRLDLDAATDLD